MPKPLTSPLVALNQSDEGLTEKISFRVPINLYVSLQQTAKGRKRSVHQLARELIILSLEAPERSDLVREVYELSAGVSLLQSKLEVLEAQNVGLIKAFGMIAEFLCINLMDLDPEVVSETVGEIMHDSLTLEEE
jgi:hypothetical protein